MRRMRCSLVSLAGKSAVLGVCALTPMVMVFGCLERTHAPSTPCTRSVVGQRIQVDNVDEVDLLFLVDNSGSMADEQVALQRELPRLVAALVSGDQDGDGEQDFLPVRSLHVGVISSDMGIGVATSTRLGSCRQGNGDDGRFQRGNAACAAGTSTFEFMRGTDATSALAGVSCATTLGTEGCGLEQQLEATLKSLTPSSAQLWTAPGYTPPRFLDPSTGSLTQAGHGLDANAGFLRPNSVLAVVLVTDEEDCSASDTTLFQEGTSARFGSDVQLRCSRFSDPSQGALHSTQRYIDGLLGLRENASLIVFSAIVGLPQDLVPTDDAPIDYFAILNDPRMQYDETGNSADFLRDSCTTFNADGSVRGSADPPRRMLETARGLQEGGASVTLSSICSDDFGPAIDGVIRKIGDVLGGACLPRDLNADAAGNVDCDVLELLPSTGSITRCDQVGGRTFVEQVAGEDGASARELCRVTQVDRARGMSNLEAGWYYDDQSEGLVDACGADGQRIAFTDVAPPVTGATVRLECLQTITLGRTSGDTVCDNDNSASAPCEIGMFCETGEADRCPTGTSLPGGGPNLVCDVVARECAVPCTADSDCTTAGLPGFVCDLRTNASAAGSGAEADIPESLRALTRGMCVNPTCN